MKLSTTEIKKSYKGRQVVKGVSVEVNQGEIVGLLGPNGAGKTTSFYMIVGLVKPDEGEVFLDDNKITTTAMYKRAKMGIGYLPQEVSVFRRLSVEDNVMAVLEMTKLNKQQRKDKLEELLSEFSLNHVRKNLGKQLSGGEKRRTEIARALATDPKFILLDEPFAGVDPIAVEDIQSIVFKLKEKNIGILITDHNVQETLSITDRAYLLFEGNILRSGTAEDLASDEVVKKVYLGQHFELKRKSFGDKVLEGDESEDERTKRQQLNAVNRVLKEVNRLDSIPEKDVETLQQGVTDFVKNMRGNGQTHPKMEECLSKMEADAKDLEDFSSPSSIMITLLLFVPIIGWIILARRFALERKMQGKLDNIKLEVSRLKSYIDNPALLNL